MNTAFRATIWSIAASLILTNAAAAQKDRIVLTDGTVLDGVTVTGFDLRNVDFRRRGSADSRSTDLVADLHVEKVRETYRRAYASIGTTEGPGNFLQQCRSLSDNFLKQFGYVEAARLFIKNGQFNDAFQVLEELATECPDSGFLPMLYQEKLRYYLSAGKAKAGDAMTVAKKYATATQTQGFPQGFAVEAKFFETMAQAVSGGLTGDRFRAQMRSLLAEAGRFPDTAARCRVQIANTLRAEGKVDEARAEYEDLLAGEAASAEVRASAWLGLGHTHFVKGSAGDTAPYLEALLAFLRVYIETPDAPAGIVSEALYMGAQAAEKWRGEDSGRMKQVLQGRLRRDYPDSDWARR